MLNNDQIGAIITSQASVHNTNDILALCSLLDNVPADYLLYEINQKDVFYFGPRLSTGKDCRDGDEWKEGRFLPSSYGFPLCNNYCPSRDTE